MMRLCVWWLDVGSEVEAVEGCCDVVMGWCFYLQMINLHLRCLHLHRSHAQIQHITPDSQQFTQTKALPTKNEILPPMHPTRASTSPLPSDPTLTSALPSPAILASTLYESILNKSEKRNKEYPSNGDSPGSKRQQLGTGCAGIDDAALAG